MQQGHHEANGRNQGLKTEGWEEQDQEEENEGRLAEGSPNSWHIYVR